jgi:hypothetical protein
MLSVITSKAKERLDLLLIGRRTLLQYSSNLILVYTYGYSRDNMAKGFDLVEAKVTFLQKDFHVHVDDNLQDSGNPLKVFFPSVGHNYDIINIDNNPFFIQLSSEINAHHPLEMGRCIFDAKGHSQVLIDPFVAYNS